MTDVFDKETRSRIMSKIRSKNTKPELFLRKELWGRNLRYRLHKRDARNADIVFAKKKVAVFVDGDFWHGYNWKKLGKTPPKKFWQAKIRRNMKRDKKTTQELESNGWVVLRFWEHDILEDVDACADVVEKTLKTAPNF
ncbi:MAG: very short patch repair endonuclease [Candidatus Thermoplasmatota archaeon]|nr:very short patch repair endonuclease [Candidatus Thermoplasmatota archaeon]